jgi:predicted dehydrogenase
MKPVGIGLIGCGLRLQGLAKRLLTVAGDKVKIVAVHDKNPASIAEAKEKLNLGDVKVHDSVQSLVNDPQIQWVMIGSWNCYHREHAVAAMEAGKDVFCEKPMATTMEDCLAIRDAQQRTGRRFFLGFTLRYSPLYRKVREVVEAGTIGRIISLEFNETLGFNHGGYIHQNWRRKRENAGTHLLEKCCHDIDIVDSIVKSPIRMAASFGGCDFFKPENEYHVQRIGPNKDGVPAFQNMGNASESPFRSDKDIVDNQVAIIMYANGIRASFHTNCMSALPERRIYVQGTEGSLRANAVPLQMVSDDPAVPAQSVLRMEVKRIGWDTQNVVTDISVSGGHGGSDSVLIDHLVECIVHGKEPITGVREGLRSAINCFGIDMAMDEQRVVDLAPLWEQAGMPLDQPALAGA